MRRLIAAAIIVAGLGAGQAAAADFTFVVPVRIENMRNIAMASVNCDVFTGESYSRRAIGFGRTDLVLADGAYSGNVSVNVDTTSGYTPDDATSWYCGLGYSWRMPDGSIGSRGMTEEERASLYTRYTGQEVASFHTQERGGIAR